MWSFSKGIPAAFPNGFADDHNYRIANNLVGADTTHGIGAAPLQDALWVLVEGAVRTGMNVARRAPPFNPT